jgi:exonuclease 3'-5' domain-containing protein 1
MCFVDHDQLFYDVRNDADALWNLYGVGVANTYDLQLLEVAVRRSSGMPVRLVTGLAKTIETYLSPPLEWQRVKEVGSRLFRPELGGSYEVFEKRPLDPRILQYAAQDVLLLFQLETTLESRIGRWGVNWIGRVVFASTRRVAESKSTFYDGKGRHRAQAPDF